MATLSVSPHRQRDRARATKSERLHLLLAQGEEGRSIRSTLNFLMLQSLRNAEVKIQDMLPGCVQPYEYLISGSPCISSG